MKPFICDNIKQGIQQLVRYKNNPHLSCPGITPARKLYLVCGQPGIGKEEQLVAMFRQEHVPTCELLVENVLDNTVKRIQTLKLGSNDVLVIRNVDILTHMMEHPVVLKFAMQLAKIGNYIVAISDVPYQSTPFYKQFQIRIHMTLPTQSYLESMFRYLFTTYAEHCRQQSIEATFELEDDDYVWLSQSSDSCTPGDVRKFCSKVFYYAADHAPITINRQFLENTDNKMMFDISGCGILSITSRDAYKTQQMYDTASGEGISAPPPTKRAKK